MAKPTYSQSLTGVGAHNPVIGYKPILVPDTSVGNISLSTKGGLAGAMSSGDVIICQGPDGGLKQYKIDAERSTPGNLVLLRV